jgi:hypothetical protein
VEREAFFTEAADDRRVVVAGDPFLDLTAQPEALAEVAGFEGNRVGTGGGGVAHTRIVPTPRRAATNRANARPGGRSSPTLGPDVILGTQRRPPASEGKTRATLGWTHGSEGSRMDRSVPVASRSLCRAGGTVERGTVERGGGPRPASTRRPIGLRGQRRRGRRARRRGRVPLPWVGPGRTPARCRSATATGTRSSRSASGTTGIRSPRDRGEVGTRWGGGTDSYAVRRKYVESGPTSAAPSPRS